MNKLDRLSLRCIRGYTRAPKKDYPVLDIDARFKEERKSLYSFFVAGVSIVYTDTKLQSYLRGAMVNHCVLLFCLLSRSSLLRGTIIAFSLTKEIYSGEIYVLRGK